MEALKQYQVQYDEFKAHFQTISHGSNISYCDYQIMRNVMTGQAVLVKPQETLSLEETEELLTTISDINIPLNQCDHFVQFLGFTEVPFEERQAEGLPISVDENGESSASSNMIYLVFEHFEDKLESIWPDLARNTEGNQKIENLLLSLARSLAESFEKLEEIGQAHTDVSLQNILAFKSSQDNLTHFKLIYSQYTTSAFRQVIDLHQSPDNYFLAPELMERLKGQTQLSQSYSGLDPQKIDVYAFGRMLLFLAAFKDPQITMEMKGRLIEDNDATGEGSFSQQLKDIVKGGYSDEFWELIQAMTDIEMAKRPNLQQISQTLSNISLVKSSKCKKTSILFFRNKCSALQNLIYFVLISEITQSLLQQPPPAASTETKDISTTTFQKSLSVHQSSQISQLEKLPLQNRAQEIRMELFSKNKANSRYHDRSASYAASSGNPMLGGVSSNQSSFYTPGRLSQLKKSTLQGTPNRYSYSPVSHSPYQQRTKSSNSGVFYSYQPLVNTQATSLHFRNEIYQSQSRISPSRASPNKLSQASIQEQYNQEYFARMLREIERDNILDENDCLRPGVLKKEYQDGSFYIGEIGQNEQGLDVRQGKGVYYYSNIEGLARLQSILLPTMLFGEIYAGEWKANLFHGNGVYLFSSGERYSGQLLEGQKSGNGVYQYSNGNYYEGEWREDLKNGYGQFFFNVIGERYEGNYVDGQRHGNGVYVFQNGDVFEGNWEIGEKSGFGEVSFSDGTKFEGEWRNNQPNGPGKMNYPNGDVYEGNFYQGMKEGDGVYIHKRANSKYEGNFRADEPMGQGQFLYSNNDLYSGDIKNGQRYGKGMYTYANGDNYSGEWKFDKKSGQGVFSFSDGSLYEGQWSSGQIKGQGTMKYANGDFYKGDWVKDKKHGKGYYKWSNGNSYQGGWRGDKMTGKGVFFSKTGQTFSGNWNENKLIAKI